PWYWIDQTGYQYSSAGENLAVNFDYSKDVVQAWMNSPTHRANIVKAKYQEIGIGIAEGFYQGRPSVFVVQMFGTPKGELGFGNVPVLTRDSTGAGASSSAVAGTVVRPLASSTNVLGASFDSISLYELIFSGKIRTIILTTIILLIILVLLLALMNPSGKMIVKIAKMALIPLAILLILYVMLIMKSGSAETSFMEF
ncbi:MAG: CAP domain-containing protein, partial [bacterium]